jgi:hypothetical protein
LEELAVSVEEDRFRFRLEVVNDFSSIEVVSVDDDDDEEEVDVVEELEEDEELDVEEEDDEVEDVESFLCLMCLLFVYVFLSVCFGRCSSSFGYEWGLPQPNCSPK